MTNQSLSANTSNDGGGTGSYNRLADGPLRFQSHNIGAYCFSTWGCRIAYGTHLIEDKDPHQWQRPLEEFPGLRERMNGSMLGYRAFEGPLRIQWRDSRKRPLELELDLSEVFPDRKIRYNVDSELIAPTASVGPPDVIVEVNDRTVRIYMRARIPLKKPRIPGNSLTDFVDDSIVVLKRTL